jgi:iron(III) transport system substrate-binding protein
MRLMIVGLFGLAMGFASNAYAQATSNYGPEWDKALAAAKKEGSVVVALGSSTQRETRNVWGIFEKKFGLKTVVSGGAGNQVTRRILAERSTGRTEVDLVGIGTASVLTELVPNNLVAPIEPLLFLPEVVDTTHWYQHQHWYADPQQKYLMMYTVIPGDTGIGINTKLVNEADIKSYWDVFDDKYKGKLISGQMNVSSGANTIVGMMVLAGPDWLTKWVQSTSFVPDADLGINYLIEGRAAIGMFLSGDLQAMDGIAEKGAPIKRLWKPVKEGNLAGRGNCCIAAVADPPHPNAQKVLINWLMSKEGQLAMQKDNIRSNSPREDIPKDMLAEDVIRPEGVKLKFMSQLPDYDAQLDKALKIIGDAQKTKK